MDDDSKLIADIYYDSGLSRVLFNKIYMNTLNKYLSKINSDDSNEALISIRGALRKRRNIYFPDGVCAEDVHSNKDVWTFVVFLSGLMLAVNLTDIKSFLNKVLDKQLIKWIKDKNAESTIYSIFEGNSDNINVQQIRAFYGFNDCVDVAETLATLEGQESTTPNKPELIESSSTDQLTNKEVGRLFIVWMMSNSTNQNEAVSIDGTHYLIKSPIAFIEFSKANGYLWKSVQKGVIKLSLHEANAVNGTPFHKVKGVNMMKFDLSIKEVLSSHADYQDQKHK